METIDYGVLMPINPTGKKQEFLIIRGHSEESATKSVLGMREMSWGKDSQVLHFVKGEK